MGSNFILLAFCLIISYFQLILCANSVIVETNSGAVKGSVINFNNKALNQFLSIPYAEPPIGSNRFGKPKAVLNWNNTLDATQEKNICWQTVTTPQTYNQSEDCLFLNIWSEHKNDTKLLPVMFWIHGGGFHDGNGYTKGMALAYSGVVFVGINYRVGPFGFLYGGDPSAPGNAGIYDQNLALKWVNDNIEHFGGDRSQITIFGQSAGSWSVSAHIVSPLSRNLFKRAIMESGAYYFRNYRNYNSSYHLNAAKQMSKAIGCEDNDKWLDCLRKADPKTIRDHHPSSPDLVFNNEILPLTVEESLKSGEFHSDIEVMAGVTDSEGTSWAVSEFPKLNNNSLHITKAEIKAKILSKFHSSSSQLTDKIYDYYISHIDESNQTLLRKAFIAIYTDTIIRCPTYYFGEKLAQYSASNKVYFYEFTYNSKTSVCHSEEWKGVCHADEVPFVFGYPINHRSAYSETDYEFSLMVNKLWTNFAKNGNPLSNSVANTLGVNVTHWPTFRDTDQSPVSPKVMELNPNKFGNLFIDPYRGSCDGVWKPYFGIE